MARLYASDWYVYDPSTGSFGPAFTADSGPVAFLDDADGLLTLAQDTPYGAYVGTIVLDGITMPVFRGLLDDPDLLSVLNPSFIDVTFPPTLPPIDPADYTFNDGIFNYITSARFSTITGTRTGITSFGTIIDRDGDMQFETGDVIDPLGFTRYAGTTTIDGIVMPVFRFGPDFIIFIPLSGESGRTFTFPETLPPITSQPFAFCFAAGTRIATPTGDGAVECLEAGDLVVLASGESVAVRWIGRQTFVPRLAPGALALVRVEAGALGPGVPQSDLTVTADHALLVGDLLINAGALINGTSIRAVPASELSERVTVYHVETEAHEVILANGAPVETFIGYADRRAFDNHAEYIARFGVERIFPEMARPRITSARMVPQALREMLARSGGAGMQAAG